MSERKLRPIDWKKTDVENFSELMAQGFADRNMEYLPGGLVLKRPKFVEDKYGSSEIQVIGIPFKNVFGQTKFRYHRVTLSGFEAVYRQLLGDEISPIRIEIKDNNDDKVLEDAKKVLAKRLAILPQRFVLELVEKKMKGPDKPQYKYKFYFSIPETDFTDKVNGLSIINDKDVFIYVEKPNIKIEAGQGIIPIEDTLVTLQGSSSSSFVRDPYSSYSDILPVEYKLIDTTIGEDFGENPVNQILYKSPGGKFRGRISPDLKADLLEISATGNLTYKDEVIESRFKASESPILKIKTVFGGEYRTPLADQIPEYRGPNAIDSLTTLSQYTSSAITIDIASLEPKQMARQYVDELTTLSLHASSSIDTNIVSKEFKQSIQEFQEALTTLSLQTSSSVNITITSGGQ
jgi:hypothetical protein